MKAQKALRRKELTVANYAKRFPYALVRTLKGAAAENL
jgi:hypothetical protein